MRRQNRNNTNMKNKGLTPMPEIKTTYERCIERAVTANSKPVTIFLVNGVKLSGILTEVLVDGLTLTRDGVTQLIFAHSIATIMPTDGNTKF